MKTKEFTPVLSSRDVVSFGNRGRVGFIPRLGGSKRPNTWAGSHAMLRGLLWKGLKACAVIALLKVGLAGFLAMGSLAWMTGSFSAYFDPANVSTQLKAMVGQDFEALVENTVTNLKIAAEQISK